MFAGCLGFFLRLLANAVAVQLGQKVVTWLWEGHLWNLLATILALVGIRLNRANR